MVVGGWFPRLSKSVSQIYVFFINIDIDIPQARQEQVYMVDIIHLFNKWRQTI